MRIQREPGYLAERFQDRNSNRQVGHEVPVHDVEMDQVGARALDLGDLFSQARKVRGEDGRGDLVLEFHAHKIPSATPSRNHRGLSPPGSAASSSLSKSW